MSTKFITLFVARRDSNFMMRFLLLELLLVFNIRSRCVASPLQGIPAAGTGFQRGILGRPAPVGPVLIYYLLKGPTLSNALIPATPTSYGKPDKFSDISDHSQQSVGVAADYIRHHNNVIPVGHSKHHYVNPAVYSEYHLLPFGDDIGGHSKTDFDIGERKHPTISTDSGKHRLNPAGYRKHQLISAKYDKHSKHSKICDHSKNSAEIGRRHRTPADNEGHQLPLDDIVENLTSADSEELISPADGEEGEEHHLTSAENENLTLDGKVGNLIPVDYEDHQIIPGDVGEINEID